MHRYVWRFVLMTVVAFATTANAQEQKPSPRVPRGTLEADQTQSAAQELAFIQREMRSLRADALAREKVERQTLLEMAARKRSLERTIEVIEDKIAKKNETLTKQRAEIQQHKDAAAKLTEAKTSLSTKLADYCDFVTELVEKSIPWQQTSRLRTIEKTLELLNNKESSASAGVTAIARIQKDEEALGRLVETSSLQIEKDGETVAVKGFHYGLLAVIFSNEDGRVVGYCKPGDKLEAGLKALEDRPQTADGYLRAIDILERRRTPTLIDLYLSAFPLLNGDS